ncbi:MAG: CoA transferase [Ardenticatenaceae bacterium]|nr:CoA transferase [Ardenticatenaceae bacterium]
MNLTVLSLEQATTVPFLTYRLVQDGARVIRVEDPRRGDPNRFVGSKALDGEEGMRTYFLPNNLGKEAITLNLGCEEGRALLCELIARLPVDIFACNQRPRSYARLGIDYETLRQVKPDLIWVGTTGFGPESDEAAYDPILQARSGLMALTGDPDGDPMIFGLPMVDLGAAEHAYGQVMKALYRRAVTGEGTRIDISMFRSALAWMVTPIMLTHSFGEVIGRRGNTHQFFAPASVYSTSDGFVYLAVGNDRQWETLTRLPGWEHLAQERYARNAGRIADVAALNQAIAELTQTMTTEQALATFRGAGVPVGKINAIPDVVEDPYVRPHLIRATDPRTGKEVCTAPPVVDTGFLRERNNRLAFPPRQGEHNARVYTEIGVGAATLEELVARGVI